MPLDLGSLTHGLASIFVGLLLIAQLRNWQTGTSSLVLLIAILTTLVWTTTLVIQPLLPIQQFFVIPLVEISKNAAWLFLLLNLLGVRKLFRPRLQRDGDPSQMLWLTLIALGLPALLALYLIYKVFLTQEIILFPQMGGRVALMGLLLVAILGLALLEQVIRNIRFHQVWHLKFLCLSLGILFTYDIYLYSNAVLFERVQQGLWSARGAVVAIAVPFMAISVLRTRKQPIQLNISRRFVFHTGVLMAAGVYLLLMASAGFYIREFSGEWGIVLQVLFWVISLTLLLVLIYSGRLRSFLKIYISRNLFTSKYDYRDEWMRINDTLSKTDVDTALPIRVIRALADTVDSPGGVIWLTTDGLHYDQAAHLEMGWIKGSELTSHDYLVQLLKRDPSMINLNDPKINLDRDQLPHWLTAAKNVWLLVPLPLHGELTGFVLLKESRVEFELNWEDYELMNAAAQQAASYLAQMVSSDALSEARQFSAFNQVSAFVVHDIKTLNSQLSLLVRNAEKHKANPEFIDDMIRTTDHAVNKMSELLKHFQKNNEQPDAGGEIVNLTEIVKELVGAATKMKPQPTLQCAETEIRVSGNSSELKACIGNLLQNAQEATSDDGVVDLSLNRSGDSVELVISDNGSGMTQEFINTRLFKPFESTKGLAGMGIGVYQCRATIRRLGGQLRVQSTVGEGSRFAISLPSFD